MKKDQKKTNNPYDITGVCNKCGSAKEINGCGDCKIQELHQKNKALRKR